MTRGARRISADIVRCDLRTRSNCSRLRYPGRVNLSLAFFDIMRAIIYFCHGNERFRHYCIADLLHGVPVRMTATTPKNGSIQAVRCHSLTEFRREVTAFAVAYRSAS
ncbi:hypothetical protein EVAR_51813_1 [Eumeta japonica]|uniref:Uncharacterized protein n=1 Tax=Eumeta variegata TaxID=151549 RepID=A0A4C1XUV2_EUMVA|nr:hypothetical protein EVAR_51813_1 [Eumeta japonica]